MIRFLAENIDYKVYSIYENVYLKTKKLSKNLDNFEESDTLKTESSGVFNLSNRLKSTLYK